MPSPVAHIYMDFDFFIFEDKQKSMGRNSYFPNNHAIASPYLLPPEFGLRASYQLYQPPNNVGGTGNNLKPRTDCHVPSQW